jgi:hypothetical protein
MKAFPLIHDSSMVIYVRDIANNEGNKLRQIVRHDRDPIQMRRRRRAEVVLASALGIRCSKKEEDLVDELGITSDHSSNRSTRMDLICSSLKARRW